MHVGVPEFSKYAHQRAAGSTGIHHMTNIVLNTKRRLCSPPDRVVAFARTHGLSYHTWRGLGYNTGRWFRCILAVIRRSAWGLHHRVGVRHIWWHGDGELLTGVALMVPSPPQCAAISGFDGI